MNILLLVHAGLHFQSCNRVIPVICFGDQYFIMFILCCKALVLVLSILRLSANYIGNNLA